MSTVISVAGLGKRYLIDHAATGVRYKSVRDALTRGAKSLFGRVLPRANNVDKSGKQEEFWALEGISFDVTQGERVGIIGRNGAGKSTLLKILSRITEPTTGRIGIRGRVASLLEVGTGFHPELTGRENIFLNGAILGMTRNEIRERFDEIVAFAEVDRFLDTPVKRYSSGMHVRLAFAVAAHLDPEILVVDEVLAVGDLQFQRKCLRRMATIGEEGRTILFVSHNLTAVNQLCSRGILLQNGRLVKDGTSAEVVSEYTRIAEEGGVAERRYDHPLVNGMAAIRRIAVMDDGERPLTVLPMSQRFAVEIDYEIGEPVSGFIVSLEIISDINNERIIAVSDPELDLSRLERRATGYYQSRVVIPGGLLNSGNYRIRVGMVRQRTIIDVREDVTFCIVDDVGIIQALGFERKNAILSLQLPWTAEVRQ